MNLLAVKNNFRKQIKWLIIISVLAKTFVFLAPSFLLFISFPWGETLFLAGEVKVQKRTSTFATNNNGYIYQ